MKWVSYSDDRGEVRAGWLQDGRVVDLARTLHWSQQNGLQVEQGMPEPPVTLLEYLQQADRHSALTSWVEDTFSMLEKEGLSHLPDDAVYETNRITFHPPIPNPPTFRDFYAFEEHVKNARGRRGLDVVPEWYRFPVFYFSNPRTLRGPDEDVVIPFYTEKMDYELEMACVIGKSGINIPVEEARQHIAGYMILNDWSARDVQAEEMKVGLGPAKGKDFATSIGPYLVTPDELEDRRRGERFDLSMTARINGELYSEGNFASIYFSFAEMIARASQACRLQPGDIIGSGTVGTGCILELGPENRPWLKVGDIVELEIERLGTLRNRLVRSAD
ncbi:MAG: fumarylacetoacetate hydrolase family protein [Bacillaceae bacterium]|nr:fumarylacetoacetate hydrolase family protein [Bacillaceae bacterium]